MPSDPSKGGQCFDSNIIIHQECRTTTEQQNDQIIPNNSYLLSKSMLCLIIPFYISRWERNSLEYSNVN